MVRILLKGVSVGGGMFFALASVSVYLQDSTSLQLQATTGAIVLATDRLSTGTYQYSYSVGERVCRGQATSPRPPPEPGTQIEVHYNPKNVCDSLTYEPVSTLIEVLIGLVGIGAWWASIFWPSWIPKRPQEVRSWNQG